MTDKVELEKQLAEIFIARIKSNGIQRFLIDLILLSKHLKSKDLYNKMLYEISFIETILKEKKEFEVEIQLLETLNVCMKELDNCNINNELKENLKKFKAILSDSLAKVQGNEAHTYLIKFARLVFLFNGYQAPPRTDPQQALKDALGETDLFDELEEEIYVEKMKEIKNNTSCFACKKKLQPPAHCYTLQDADHLSFTCTNKECISKLPLGKCMICHKKCENLDHYHVTIFINLDIIAAKTACSDSCKITLGERLKESHPEVDLKHMCTNCKLTYKEEVCPKCGKK